MNLITKVSQFFSKPFFSKYSTVLGLWLLLAIIAWIAKSHIGAHNNFLIFKNVFWHTLQELPLYAPYPAEYNDVNHYGPFFSLVIAPFAVLPTWAGLLMWLLGSSLFLYVATRLLPLSPRKHIFIYWFCAHELLTALFMSQFNIGIAAIILLSYIFIEKEKDEWSAFFIIFGTFIKLYGIVGLAFFFFSRHKLKFILSCFGWSVVLFLLPMAISGPEYIISQYVDWYTELVVKNQGNLFAPMQNISLLGMIRKTTECATYSDIYPILGGLILFGLPYLRISQYKHIPFRLALVSSVLLFTVLFSTGSESSSYIIAFIGVAIWYVSSPWKRTKTDLILLIFAFILTSMSPSDLFPRYLREMYIKPYALKALPCVLIWLKLCYEMCVCNYSEKTSKSQLA